MDLVEEQLRNSKTIAVVGLSDNPERDSPRGTVRTSMRVTLVLNCRLHVCGSMRIPASFKCGRATTANSGNDSLVVNTSI